MSLDRVACACRLGGSRCCGSRGSRSRFGCGDGRRSGSDGGYGRFIDGSAELLYFYGIGLAVDSFMERTLNGRSLISTG